MEGSRHGEQDRAFDAACFGDLDRVIDGCSRTGQHDLAAAVVICHLAHAAQQAGIERDRSGPLWVDADQSDHSALADPDGLLHRLAA